jgi:imidazolonepropionase
MGMTPAEALVAGTTNAAAALDLPEEVGTLQKGAPGDVAVLDAPTYVHVPYNFGVNTVDAVLKDGEVVY